MTAKLIRMPSMSGPTYDVFVTVPGTMSDEDACGIVNREIDAVKTLDTESIKNGGDGVGLSVLLDRLAKHGFSSCGDPIVTNDWD